MELVENIDDIIANLSVFESYRENTDLKYSEFYKARIQRGNVFVVASVGGQTIFCPSRVVGYKNCTMERHRDFQDKNGNTTNKRISQILGENKFDNEAEILYVKLCNELKCTFVQKNRTYWHISNGDDISYPEEITTYIEGATKHVCVNVYERNPQARRVCLEHYGLNCAVCNFNFETKYGLIGENFIHVHHLVPIAEIGKAYKVNPIDDLRPVCPNCHSMLHKRNPPLSIDELKELVAK